MIKREYEKYNDYIKFQSEKTLNPEKRKKWLTEEWQSKIDGFKNEFSKLKNQLTPDKKCLCLGARTGQEVVALKELGIEDVVGIDIVPNLPYVVKGDIHNLSFENESFDFVYTNIIDHSINPKKMISEIERVLKVDGIFYLQIQLGLNQDKYTEFEITNPIFDLITLFDQSYCVTMGPVNKGGSINFAGMNFELIFTKDEKLKKLYDQYGSIKEVNVPEEYQVLWEEINLPIQTKKLDDNKITNKDLRKDILKCLKSRAYYLTRICEIFECRNICEIGTAEGWQFFSFCEYASKTESFVVSCDPRDVRNKKYKEKYKSFNKYLKGTSLDVSRDEDIEDFDMIYVDGMHDKGSVITEVANLIEKQSKEKKPVWVFDDFDIRFGCFEDICKIVNASNGFKVWNVGYTASGNPSHQVLVNTRYSIDK